MVVEKRMRFHGGSEFWLQVEKSECLGLKRIEVGELFEGGARRIGEYLAHVAAERMFFAARWGSACGTPFDAKKFLAVNPQFDWMESILRSRCSHPWTDFHAGE
jgi:hypothetical protein